jgi:hypothetical protein
MLSRHFKERLQQRAIPSIIVDILNAYGIKKYNKDGTVTLFFNHDCKKKVSEKIPLKLIEKYLNTYLIKSLDGDLITIGYRTKRVFDCTANSNKWKRTRDENLLFA